MRKKTFLTITIIAFCAGLNAQGDVASLTKLLTGNSKKEWVRTRWRMTMGKAKERPCLEGLSYVFRKDSALTIVECTNGQKTAQVAKWALKKQNEDNILTIGSKSYRLLYSTTQSKQQIKLRSLVNTKIEPSEEIILRYEND